MSLQNRQNLLAKLYTDAEFRRDFLSQPEKVGAENDLSPDEVKEIAAIVPEDLEFFTESLLRKRLREVEKFLPLTKKILVQSFEDSFREFASGFNPPAVKKHFADALGFAAFLEGQKVPDLAKNAAKYERAKLKFFGLEKRLVICRLDYDVRKLFDQSSPEFNLRRDKKIAVWVKTGQRIRHFFI